MTIFAILALSSATLMAAGQEPSSTPAGDPLRHATAVCFAQMVDVHDLVAQARAGASDQILAERTRTLAGDCDGAADRMISHDGMALGACAIQARYMRDLAWYLNSVFEARQSFEETDFQSVLMKPGIDEQADACLQLINGQP